MAVYIILTALTVAMACPVQKPVCGGNNTENDGKRMGIVRPRFRRGQLCNIVCLTGIFTLLFAVSACRYRVGNDYTRYEEFFHLIPLKQVVPTEFGFNRIVLLMQFLFGIDTKLTIFALFAFVTVFFMVKAVYDQSENFLFSFFLFMTLSYYFQSLNTVRYYLAWAVAVFSMKYVLKKQYGRFILLILLTATIHKSVLLVIPVYILANFPWKRWQIFVLAVVSASGIFLKDLYLKAVVLLYPSYENTSYLDGGTSVINIVRIIGVLVFTLIYYRQAIAEDRQNRFYFQLNIFALLLYLCGSFIPEISRVGYYMTAGHIFLLPSVIAKIEDRRRRRFWTVVIVLAAVLYFGIFLIKAQDLLVRIVPYHTWIFDHAA